MEALIEQLKVLLASSFSFYLKAHNFHWNVTGPNFKEYHDFLGDVYAQAHADVDSYAEMIRVLDAFAPGSLTRFAELTRVQDELNIPLAAFMIARLEMDNDIMRTELYACHRLAEASGQAGVINFLEDRIQYHDKLSWMLKSFNK
jgi:starvation-inducible DNA-binding protein